MAAKKMTPSSNAPQIQQQQQQQQQHHHQQQHQNDDTQLPSACTSCTASSNFKVEKTSTRACALKLARNVVKYVDSYSKIKNPEKEESIPCFLQEEIILGKLLGKGGFNQVYAVDRVELVQSCHGRPINDNNDDSNPTASSHSNEIDRSFSRRISNLNESSHHAISDILNGLQYSHKLSTPIQQHNRLQLCHNVNSQVEVVDDSNIRESSTSSSDDCSTSSSHNGSKRTSTGSSYTPTTPTRRKHHYAIKYLTRQTMENEESYCNGAADLIMETKILSNLQSHPNVITLHGVAAAGITGIAEGAEGSYFLILDRLEQTLDKRLDVWKQQKKKGRHKSSIIPSLMERSTIAFHIASGIKHLHEHGIIFRDLKPENIGFDMDGTLKIFDFGLAKELDPRQQSKHDDTIYHMSCIEGSRGYMAPEVVLGKPYGLSSDVYSFGVLLWELFALEEPYCGMSLKQHTNLIIKGTTRLPLDTTKWSKRIRNIMKWSWMREHDMRPSISEITRSLKSELRSRTSTTLSNTNSQNYDGYTTRLDMMKRMPSSSPSLSRSYHNHHRSSVDGSTTSSSLLSTSSLHRSKMSLSNSYHHHRSNIDSSGSISSYNTSTSSNNNNNKKNAAFPKIPSNIVDFIKSDNRPDSNDDNTTSMVVSNLATNPNSGSSSGTTTTLPQLLKTSSFNRSSDMSTATISTSICSASTRSLSSSSQISSCSESDDASTTRSSSLKNELNACNADDASIPEEQHPSKATPKTSTNNSTVKNHAAYFHSIINGALNVARGHNPQ